MASLQREPEGISKKQSRFACWPDTSSKKTTKEWETVSLHCTFGRRILKKGKGCEREKEQNRSCGTKFSLWWMTPNDFVQEKSVFWVLALKWFCEKKSVKVIALKHFVRCKSVFLGCTELRLFKRKLVIDALKTIMIKRNQFDCFSLNDFDRKKKVWHWKRLWKKNSGFCHLSLNDFDQKMKVTHWNCDQKNSGFAFTEWNWSKEEGADVATEKENIPTTRQVSSRLTISETTRTKRNRWSLRQLQAKETKRNGTDNTIEGQRKEQSAKRQKEDEGWKRSWRQTTGRTSKGRTTRRIRRRKKRRSIEQESSWKKNVVKNCCGKKKCFGLHVWNHLNLKKTTARTQLF